MNLTVRNEYRVEAVLNTEELKAYGITYEEIDYKNIDTRRVLWSLLDDIRNKHGISLCFSGKMLIEVIKEGKDKIRLCFTVLTPRDEDGKSVKLLVKSEEQPFIMQFNDFEELLSAIQMLEGSEDSALYENKGKYRLVFFHAHDQKIRLNNRLCEYGEEITNPLLSLAECTEHWNEIVKEGAVERLRKAFSVSQLPFSYHL